MASLADAENLWAWTVSGLLISPLARILTGTSAFLARPVALRASSVTSAPLSKRASRSCTFTPCVCVRNISNGIDFFMCGPRSLRIRMWIGIWPPSNRARSLAPEREPAPFWPRPEVLPRPEPSPRPTRLRGRREPGAGFRLWSPIGSFSLASSAMTSVLLDLDQVADAVEHAAGLLAVLDLDRVADPAQPQRAQRVELALVGAVLALDLRHLGHQACASPSAASASTGASSGAPSRVSPAGASLLRP